MSGKPGARQLRRLALTALIAVLMLAMGALGSAFAQLGPFGGIRPPAAVGVAGWILARQALFYRALAVLIRAAKTDGSASWSLMGISFIYGIFHAAGPGHGKAVISSYLVANGETWRRGVALSFAAALLQATTAVVIVAIAAVLIGATAKAMGETVKVIEIVSYTLIVLLGARLAWVKGRGFLHALRQVRSGAEPADAHGHARDQYDTPERSHAHEHSQHQCSPAHHRESAPAGGGACGHELLHNEHARDAHAHDENAHDENAHDENAHDENAHGHAHRHAHGHVHSHDEEESVLPWGHAHGPEPEELAGPGGWRRGFSAIFAVGLRPCSGAIIVLVFALAQGMLWAGIASTFVMGVGTAITVAAIATLAVGAKAVAKRVASTRAGYGSLALRGMEVGAAVLVIAFGVLLLTGYMASERMGMF